MQLTNKAWIQSKYIMILMHKIQNLAKMIYQHNTAAM